MITELVGLPGCGKSTYVRSLRGTDTDIILVEDINWYQRVLALPLAAVMLPVLLVNQGQNKFLEVLRLSIYVSTISMIILFKIICRRDVVIDQFLLQFAISLGMRNLNNQKIFILIKIFALFVEYRVINVTIDFETYTHRYANRSTYTSTKTGVSRLEFELFGALLNNYRQRLLSSINFTENIDENR